MTPADLGDLLASRPIARWDVVSTCHNQQIAPCPEGHAHCRECGAITGVEFVWVMQGVDADGLVEIVPNALHSRDMFA